MTVQVRPFPRAPRASTSRVWFVLHTAADTPLLSSALPGIPRPTALGRLVRECWRNLPIEYPCYGFERLVLAPDRITAAVRGPTREGPYPPVRGIIAHFKALVTRASGRGLPVWAPGHVLLATVALPDVPLATGAADRSRD